MFANGRSDAPWPFPFRVARDKLLLWRYAPDPSLTAFAPIDDFKEVEKRDPRVRESFRCFPMSGVFHRVAGPGPSRLADHSGAVGEVWRPAGGPDYPDGCQRSSRDVPPAIRLSEESRVPERRLKPR